MTEAGTEFCDKCENGAKITKKGVWICSFCLREYDNRSGFQLWIARAMPYVNVVVVLLLSGAIAVVIGRTTWDLTWSDTLDFAGLAVILMFFVGLLGAATQAHLLGADLWRSRKSIGEELQEKHPYVFYAPWVLVSVLAAALIVEHSG